MTSRPFSTWTSTDWARASIVTLFATWVPLMFRSLWIDELGSYWVIEGTFHEAIARATEVQGQSPFTYAVMWAWNRVLSPSDFGLRVLPVLFGVATLVVLFSIGKRLGGSATGWYAVAIAMSLYEFRAMMVNFRPYAFALFFLALSTRLLIAWDDKPSGRTAIGYVLATTAVIWSVFYFGFALISHAVFIAVRRRESSQTTWIRFLTLLGWSAVLCLPLIPQLIALSSRADTLQFSSTPLLREVLNDAIPFGMAAAWVIVMLVVGFPDRTCGRRSDRWLISSLFIAPTAVIYVLTLISDLALWTVRYRSAFLLGFALVAAAWISGYSHDAKRIRALLLILLAGILISQPSDFSTNQDWRAGLQMADSTIASDGLVVLVSGFIEASSLEALENPTTSQFIGAAFSRYPVRQETLLAPTYATSDVAVPYLVEKLAGTSYSEIAVVGISGNRPGSQTFELVLGQLGFTEAAIERFGTVEVIIYEK